MVRCGPCLPAVLLIAFFAGTRLDWWRLALAAALCMAAVTLQASVMGAPIYRAMGYEVLYHYEDWVRFDSRPGRRDAVPTTSPTKE